METSPDQKHSTRSRHSDGTFAPEPVTDRFWAQVAISEICWEWQGRHTDDGYGRTSLGGHHNIGAHCLAWELATGSPVPSGLDVLHTCDNPPCVRNDDEGLYIVNGITLPRRGHLFLGTHADNALDRQAKGRSKNIAQPGSQHFAAKLTEADIVEIRALSRSGLIAQAIADRFGVSRGHIAGILTGRTWTHVA